MTTVTGTIYRADGATASGNYQISWPAFTDATGLTIAAGVLNGTIGGAGVLSVSLSANNGGSSYPVGTYYTVVFTLSDGTVGTEYWSVPVGGSVSVASVRTQIAPAAISTALRGLQGGTGLTGATGPANTLAIGTVSSLSPGASATATVTGTAPTQTLNLGIPQGIQGPVGGALSTSIAPVASGSGAVGTSTSSARADHFHPSEVAGASITPASVSIGGAVVQAPLSALNPQQLAHAFTDSAGNGWLWCDMTGATRFKQAIFDAVSFNQAPTFPSAVINDTSLIALASKWLASSKAVTDSAGAVTLTVMPDGSLLAPQGIKGKFLSGVCVDSDGCIYYSQLDGVAGLIQLFKSDPLSGMVWQLTHDGNNYAPQVSSDGTRLSFISDRNGAEQVFVGDLWAVVKVPANQDLRTLYQYNHFNVTGQSLSIGYASNALTTVASTLYNNLMFNAGPRCSRSGGSAVLSASITSLVPLVEVTEADETLGTTNDGETICSGMLNRIAQDLLAQGVLFVGIGSVCGVIAQPYSVIKKGASNSIYLNTLTEITAAMALAAAAGKSYGTRAVSLVHGQADQIAGTQTYAQLLAQLQSNYNADIKAITGQSTDVPLMLIQMSDWTSAAGGNTAVGTIVYAQLAAHEAAPGKIILVGPSYFLPTGADPHLTNAGYRQMAEYFGKVGQRIMGQGKAWRPLSPRQIQRSGKQILVKFWVPVEPLVIDTTTITPPTANSLGLNGFEYFDNSGAVPAISSVAVVGPNSVLITLASIPTGTGNRIRYAYTATAGHAPGATTGGRGCLRDSDVSTSVYGYSMYNWCVHFDKAC